MSRLVGPLNTHMLRSVIDLLDATVFIVIGNLHSLTIGYQKIGLSLITVNLWTYAYVIDSVMDYIA